MTVLTQVREPLRLLLLRPEDDRQDQILRGRPQARLQEVLRQVRAISRLGTVVEIKGSQLVTNASLAGRMGVLSS